jgi:hypothetical protein
MARRWRTLAAGVSLAASESGSEDGSAVGLVVVDDEVVVVVVLVAVVVLVVDVGHATHELGPEIGAGTTIRMRLKGGAQNSGTY